MKQIIAKIGLLFFGLVLSALMLEVVLRLTNVATPNVRRIDPETGLLTLQPSQDIPLRAACLTNTVTTNQYGFHGREYPFDKADGVYRIVVLGDSFVESMQVSLDDTFYAILEDKLNATQGLSYKYEIIPIGISARGTYLNLHYLTEYGLRFQPDLVIDAFLVHNDVYDDFFNGTRSVVPGFDHAGNVVLDIATSVYVTDDSLIEQFFKQRIISNSALLQLLYKKYSIIKANQTVRDKAVEDKSNLEGSVAIYLRDYSEAWKDAWRKESLMLRSFKKISVDNGAQFLLVSLAEGYRVHQDLFDQLPDSRKDPEVFDYDRPEELLAAIAHEHDFAYHALLPYFRQQALTTEDHIVWSCDAHWTKLGHRWAAESLYQYLLGHTELLGVSSVQEDL